MIEPVPLLTTDTAAVHTQQQIDTMWYCDLTVFTIYATHQMHLQPKQMFRCLFYAQQIFALFQDMK